MTLTLIITSRFRLHLTQVRSGVFLIAFRGEAGRGPDGRLADTRGLFYERAETITMTAT